MNISVVVVCYNEKENIEQCLFSLTRQKYPQKEFEILFVDNGSTDGTQETIRNYARRFPQIRMIVNPIRGIAGSRNVGLRESRFDHIAFIDADCIAPVDWLPNLAHGFATYAAQDDRLVAVGGANIPPKHSSLFYDVLELFLNTYLGSHGSVQGMKFLQDRPVAHLPTVNALFYKPALLGIGGFDVTLGNIGEDQDLSYRLQDQGYHFYYLANAAITHKLRTHLRAWIRNMFIYGKGRMWLMRKHPGRIEWVLLLPFFLVASLPLVFLSWCHLGFAVPWLYFPVIFLVSIYESFRAGKLELLFHLFRLYIATHVAYGLGEWYGLFKNREFDRMKNAAHLMVASES